MRKLDSFKVCGRRPYLCQSFKSDERGSLTIFSLFVFMMILMICGVAVDLMRYENERVAVQNTLDTAVVAASGLNQNADTNEKVTALVKDYFEKAGYDPDIVTVTPNIEIPAGGTEETSRSVTAVVDFDLNTMFMNMVGVDSLPGAVGGGAAEGQQLIEVALVLDVSGSMGWGTKLQDMKDAAKSFVTTLITNNGENRVLISVLPYNQQLYMSDDLKSRLDLNDAIQTIENPPYANSITAYRTANPNSKCARFLDADFDSRRLSAAPAPLEMSAHFDWNSDNYNTPSGNNFWCGLNRTEMLLFQSNETVLHTYIDSLSAGGWTSVDYGMKWAVGVLDPSFASVVAGMHADTVNPDNSVTLVPDHAIGHPVDYATPNVLKYVVLMTDGTNTTHLDLDDEFKAGPSRIWASERLACSSSSSASIETCRSDGDYDEYDGYLVHMPGNSEAQRWYRPRNRGTSSDDEYLSETEFLALDAEAAADENVDLVQWSYHDVYDRFAVHDAANYFFATDAVGYNEHINADIDAGGYATADTNLQRICEKAQENDWIEVFTVAFEAPTASQTVLDNCALKADNYFAVAGSQLTDAFNSIAAEISKLRLTQ